jgi:hypothetical protein
VPPTDGLKFPLISHAVALPKEKVPPIVVTSPLNTTLVIGYISNDTPLSEYVRAALIVNVPDPVDCSVAELIVKVAPGTFTVGLLPTRE